MEDAWYGVLSGVSQAFLAVYVLRLGGSNALVGLLTSLPALITIFWLVPAGRIVERQPDRVRLVVVTSFLFRLAYLFVAVVPSVLATHRSEAVVAVVAVGTLATSVAGVALNSVLADVVPLRQRAKVISIRKSLFSIVTTTTALLGGWLLDFLSFPANFQILFAIGFAASLVSLYYQAQLRPPLGKPRVPSPTVRQSPAVRIRGYLAKLGSHPPFKGFAASSLIYHFGLYLSIPLYSIYWVRVLQAGNSWIGAIGMITNAAAALTYPLWGRAAMKYGIRKIFVVGALAGVLYPGLTALSPSVEPLLLVGVVGGVASAGFGLGHFGRLLEITPDENRPTFLAAYDTLINTAVFVAPIVGTGLIESIGIANALILGSLIRFLGLLAYSRWG